MLHVPTLEPGQEPFDLNQSYLPHPSLKGGGHILALPKSLVSAAPLPSPATAAEDDAPDLTILLDHILAKDAITTLHIEDDEQSQKLLAYSHNQICDIIPDYTRFIKAQRDKYTALLKTNRQRHLFALATQAYFDRAPAHAQSLRDKRIRQFQIETIERQNKEFVARALRPEAVMDDRLQHQYRDMILHNIEFLLADADPAERDRALDRASRELYASIIEARLALTPENITPLLDSPAVRRVLSREALAGYKVTMHKAILRNTLTVKAAAWVDEDITPAEAKRRAVAYSSDADAQTLLLALFTQIRINLFRNMVLQTLSDAETVWRELQGKGYDPLLLPAWVKNGDQERLDCILSLLARREKNGGAPEAPEYCFALTYFEEFCPEKSLEHLARKESAYDFIDRAGGFVSPLYPVLVRLLLGAVTLKDRNWLDCLAQARDAVIVSPGEDVDTADINRFIHACDTVRRLRLDKRDDNEMDPVEMLEIINHCKAASSSRHHCTA